MIDGALTEDGYLVHDRQLFFSARPPRRQPSTMALRACVAVAALAVTLFGSPVAPTMGMGVGAGPAPPAQTREQKRVMDAIAARASAQSEAALPALLAVLGSANFTALLAPELRHLGAAALWERYTDELGFVEILHGFPAANNATQNNALDIDIDIATQMDWFPNQWQLPILYPERELKSYYSLISFLASTS